MVGPVYQLQNKRNKLVFIRTMISTSICDNNGPKRCKGARSHSAQGLACSVSSPAMKLPLPPRPWITDCEDESSDDADSSVTEEGVISVERTRVRSRYRHHKQRQTHVPIGIFWDIENCQIPRGCSAIDVVAAIRSKFVSNGRREADFVVVCDVRKETTSRLLELNDAQVSLIHVCRTQKNAADDKLRQCMRRFGDLHVSPAAILLISGDIDFAADLSDFRYRKNMEVILVHKKNTSAALIACASAHYCFDELASGLPRKTSKSEGEEPSCELEVTNLPTYEPLELVSMRLRNLAKKCGGRVVHVKAPNAVLKFSTPDHASRALMRMDGEDVYGRKISTRYARSAAPPTYSSDEGYSTAPNTYPPTFAPLPPPPEQLRSSNEALCNNAHAVAKEWALALQQLPAATPPPHDFCPPPAPKPRKIRGTHGSINLDRSGCSSSTSVGDGRQDISLSRAVSPWNSSASFSEHSESEESPAELTVSNLPPYDPPTLQEMLTQLFNQFVPTVRVSVWSAGEGPLASIVLRSEWDARFAIARIHKRRLDNQWNGRRLELSLGKPSPAPNLDVLRARLRAILLDQKNYTLPLLRLRDAYASRHCCALTTSDISKLRDTVVIHEGFGRMVQLVDLTPVVCSEMEEAPWKCHIHASMSTGQEDGSRILQPVYMEISVLAMNVHILLEAHGGILPLLSFVECYEARFNTLVKDAQHGVALELLLRSVPGLEVRDAPSRHLTWKLTPLVVDSSPPNAAASESSRSSGDRDRPRTAPVLEPMLALFERELIDLLRTAPRCSIPFSKLIPAFHHHFGRQCRVADYGFTKLPDLLSALSNAIVVLGSGSSRIITISAAAQSRRWTSDLVKLLKAQPGRVISIHDIPELYQATFGRPFTPVDYGVCTIGELMQGVGPQAVSVGIDGTIALPRRAPTPEERARTRDFAMQAVELLRHTPNFRMEFSRFVPAYHAHFGRQLRVAHYGCVKLVELFELIPSAVAVSAEHSGERSVRLAYSTARPAFGHRLRTLPPVTLQDLPKHYAHTFGAPPLPDMLDADSVEALVYAAGGCIENGIVVPPGASPAWGSCLLAACAALSGDRSVARGSTHEYFIAAFRKMRGTNPDLRRLAAAGVIIAAGGYSAAEARLCLAPLWRTVWRLAQLLADRSALASSEELFIEYAKRYEPVFPGDAGPESVAEFLRQYMEIFDEVQPERWALCAAVVVPRCRELLPPEDYSIHDTPPGQKGSRVFESPKTNNIWCSPPASALPAPTALLSQDNRRRIRLAAHFDCS